jgi:hypothetical protein
VVVDLEARLLLGAAVDARQVDEHVELEAGRRLQVRARLGDVPARDEQRQLAERLDGLGEPRLVLAPQRRDQLGRRRLIRRTPRPGGDLLLALDVLCHKKSDG